MKFSDILYEHAADLWEEAAKKPFVVEMAEGTLSPDRFRFYMLQDYLYLQDYIDILKSFQTFTNKPSLRAFLDRIIEETEQETYRVHVPNMKKIGVRDEDIRGLFPYAPAYRPCRKYAQGNYEQEKHSLARKLQESLH